MWKNIVKRGIATSGPSFTSPVGVTFGAKTSAKTPKLNIVDIAETLKNDPNLEDFYDEDTLRQVRLINKESEDNVESSSWVDDGYNLSLIKGMEKYEDDQNIHINHHRIDPVPPSINMMNEPQTMKTSDFIKLLNKDGHLKSSTPYDFDSMEPIQKPKENKRFKRDQVEQTKDPYISFKHFLTNLDTPNTMPNMITPLESLVNSELPLVFISNLRNPTLNLAIEKYIYDQYPDVKNPLNRFARRLMLYKNMPCIVVGKNQNIYKEINFRYTSSSEVKVLRRYSGGGTVVHDLGNFNFSFMCPKDEFDRVGFTSHLIDTWNIDPNTSVKLNINEKGDMVDSLTNEKVSGSAFQISKGKSLHHGTMLLNSDLKTLGKLLKINDTRLASIKDKATNSIPSPIKNTNVNHHQFISLLVDAFTKGYGLPTKMKAGSKPNQQNQYVFQRDQVQTQVIVIDDLTPLPSQVYEIEKELKSWQWVFGKTPRFEQEMTLEGGSLSVKFTIVKGQIAGMEYERLDGEKEHRFALLAQKLNSEDAVYYRNDVIDSLIEDKALSKEMGWNVDQLMKYQTRL